METVVVLATYNEADNIERLLYMLREYTVVLVDDNSPDGTGEIAKTFLNVHLISRPCKLGIASAYYDGFKYALTLNPDYIVQMDAGLTHNPKDIKAMLNMATSYDADLVSGNRFTFPIVGRTKRTLLSNIASALMRFIGINVQDATCGFRLWKPSLLRRIVNSQWISTGFAFQLETLHMAKTLSGMHKIRFVPIEYKLTNSSLNWKILLEAIKIYAIIFWW
jgi:dolichol-phosphate mannosyltransferase